MSYLRGVDVSVWQGNINWSAVAGAGIQFAIIKMSGGDAGLYFDPKASANYAGAKSAGLVVAGYHFAGDTDPIAEADKFVAAMSPVAENDLFILDFEVPSADPVGWCHTFTTHVHDKTGVWCLLYINLGLLNAHDWSPVLANCGLYLADWAVSPDANAPTNHTYVMQQYSDAGTIPGIGARVDLDAFFGSVAQLQAYGYHAPVAPAPAPPPDPQPTPTPTPIQDVTPPSPEPPVVDPTPSQPAPEPGQGTPPPTPDTTPVTPAQSWISKIINLLKRIFGVK